jgi:hypothetical protein
MRDGEETTEFWAKEWDHREAQVFAGERPWESADIGGGADISLSEISAKLGLNPTMDCKT